MAQRGLEEDNSGASKMKNLKQLMIPMLLIASIIAGGFFYWTVTADRRNAERVISAIEDYRVANGKLPDPDDHQVMKSLGFELREGRNPDYEVDEKGLYRITILAGFDGPYWTYDSFSQSWREEF